MAAAAPAVTSTSRQEEGKFELEYFYQENINFHIPFHQENINSANSSLNLIGQDQLTGHSLSATESGQGRALSPAAPIGRAPSQASVRKEGRPTILDKQTVLAKILNERVSVYVSREHIT